MNPFRLAPPGWKVSECAVWQPRSLNGELSCELFTQQQKEKKWEKQKKSEGSFTQMSVCTSRPCVGCQRKKKVTDMIACFALRTVFPLMERLHKASVVEEEVPVGPHPAGNM